MPFLTSWACGVFLVKFRRWCAGAQFRGPRAWKLEPFEPTPTHTRGRAFTLGACSKTGFFVLESCYTARSLHIMPSPCSCIRDFAAHIPRPALNAKIRSLRQASSLSFSCSKHPSLPLVALPFSLVLHGATRPQTSAGCEKPPLSRNSVAPLLATQNSSLKKANQKRGRLFGASSEECVN